MIPGLHLRVSQHLALTPQLQQSIRLLQLSTLEMAAEVEQMLDDNPFLERDLETAEREEFGLDKADAPLQDSADSAIYSIAAGAGAASAEGQNDAETTAPTDLPDLPDWDGDGSSDLLPDDGAKQRGVAPLADARFGIADVAERAREVRVARRERVDSRVQLLLAETHRIFSFCSLGYH